MDEVGQVLAQFPRVYFACHARHRRDPRSGRLVSERQASVLDHLDAEEPIALNELARHMGVTDATMCIAVDRLVAGRWVRRDPDPRDRRRVCLRLTASGVRLKSARTVLDPQRVRDVLMRLSRAERAEALRGLALLARASDEEIAGWREERK